MAHLKPLPAETHPELGDDFALFERILGFVPNSLLTLQRKPKIVQGFAALTKAVMDPSGEVDAGFKRLLAHVSSLAAGCRYCQAHSLVAAQIHGVSKEKLEALAEYPTSPHFNEAERVALDFALAAGAVPNAVDEPLMRRMRQHWSENQIVEILAAVCLYGFLNRWNDSMATDLEDVPHKLAREVLGAERWSPGKHGIDKT